MVISSSSEDEFSNCDEAEANDGRVDRSSGSTVSSAQIAEDMHNEQETIASTSNHSNEVRKAFEPANNESSHHVDIIGLLWWKSKQAFSTKD